MNRLLICIILLGIGNLASAETLYRWIEPDGSITFSPTKPPAGVDFKVVDSAAANSSTSDQAIESSAQPSILATSEHSQPSALPQINDTKIQVQPAPAVVTRQGLNYAPDTSPGPIAAIEPDIVEPLPANPAQKSATVASASKRRQCQDLSKRVMSLERRLRSPLQAEDMDNTVMAMARYQRSFDRHCIE